MNVLVMDLSVGRRAEARRGTHHLLTYLLHQRVHQRKEGRKEGSKGGRQRVVNAEEE